MHLYLYPCISVNLHIECEANISIVWMALIIKSSPVISWTQAPWLHILICLSLWVGTSRPRKKYLPVSTLQLEYLCSLNINCMVVVFFYLNLFRYQRRCPGGHPRAASPSNSNVLWLSWLACPRLLVYFHWKYIWDIIILLVILVIFPFLSR